MSQPINYRVDLLHKGDYIIPHSTKIVINHPNERVVNIKDISVNGTGLRCDGCGKNVLTVTCWYKKMWLCPKCLLKKTPPKVFILS
jgi:hypothetical protein